MASTTIKARKARHAKFIWLGYAAERNSKGPGYIKVKTKFGFDGTHEIWRDKRLGTPKPPTGKERREMIRAKLAGKKAA